MHPEPNYNHYTREELEQALETIDQEKYPERVKKINGLLKAKTKTNPYKVFKQNIFSAKEKVNEYITFPRLGWLDKVSLVLCIWVWFFPHPYQLLIAALIALPIAGIVINGFGKPSISTLVTFKSGREKYDLADFIDLPAYTLLIRVLLDFEYDSLANLWITGLVFLLVVSLILVLTHDLVMHEKVPDKATIYFLIFFHVGLYSYVSVLAINCTYDNSEPKEFSTQIINKYISKGRKQPTLYYVTVRPWGEHRETEDIKVARSEYESYEIGDNVKVDLQEGLLGIPWYYITKEQ